MIFLYLFLCLIFAALFAGTETGLLSVNRMLMQEKKEKGVFYARAVEFLLSKPERLLGTTLIGHNIANVSAAVLLTNHFENLGYGSYTWIGIIGMAFVFLVFDDFIPKSFLRTHANTIAARLAPVLLGFYAFFLPIYLVLNNLVKVILFFTGRHRASREELRTKRDLRFVVNLTGKEAGLPAGDQRMLEDILHFRDQIAREVMVPFHKLPVLNLNQDTADAVRLAVDTGSRFIPVSQHRTDNMIGYVDTTELLWKDGEKVSEVMLDPVFYPETRSIPDLLLDMNRKEEEVVFLVDEYGGVAGMLTPSQIVADIVAITLFRVRWISKSSLTPSGYLSREATPAQSAATYPNRSASFPRRIRSIEKPGIFSSLTAGPSGTSRGLLSPENRKRRFKANDRAGTSRPDHLYRKPRSIPQR
jgi:CBS domain containing-hemolysin-like protein